MKVERNNLNRKVFALKDFRGVDYASSPLEVQPYRATDMANLLLRDGQLQKRYGFKQLFHSGASAPENGYKRENQKVNVWNCGANKFVVEFTGRGIVKANELITYGEEDGELKQLGMSKLAGFMGDDDGSTAVFYNGCLYLFLMAKGVYKTDDGIDFDKVTPYVPITTINVPMMALRSNGSSNSLVVDNDIEFPYQNNESLNMLSTWRRNTVLIKRDFEYDNLFGDGYEQVGAKFFKLDGLAYMPSELKDNHPPKITATVDNKSIELGEFGTSLRNDIFGDSANTDFAPKDYWYNEYLGVAVVKKRERILDSGKYPELSNTSDLSSLLVICDEEKLKTRLTSLGVRSNEYGYYALTLEYEPVYEGDIYEKEYYTIAAADHATVFGVDGAEDRIIVACGNKIYISENQASLEADVSYFPVDQFIECGRTASPIKALMRVSDGTLAVFKDVSANEDVSVYYVNGYYESLGVGGEGNEYKRARFTVKAGDIRRTGISAGTVANLEGDNIFTSKEGVYGIQLSDNVASGERYARERSRTINPKITQFDLQKARGIVYKDKYFLAVGNGEVYVADARYTFTMQGDQQNTFNYEWFRLTGLYVKEWFIFNNELYFVDKDEYICKFTDNFADQYMVTTDNNELTVNTETVTFNEERLGLIKASSYAVDQEGRTWQLQLTEDEKEIVIPEDIKIAENADLTLWFHVPIASYWQSAVLSLDNPMYRKNMWALSMTAAAEHGGMINLGYKTRLNAVNNIEIEGVNKGGYEDISFLGALQTFLISDKESAFGMYTFDVGGYVGVNSYRRRLFERDFVHIQLLFTSKTVNDCAVSEVDIEYAISKKNIGVG
jgi:hypothetical protein